MAARTTDPLDAPALMRGLLPEAATRRREVYCLQERLASFGLTTRITSKPVGATVRDRTPQTDAVAQFMADCAVVRIFGTLPALRHLCRRSAAAVSKPVTASRWWTSAMNRNLRCAMASA